MFHYYQKHNYHHLDKDFKLIMLLWQTLELKTLLYLYQKLVVDFSNKINNVKHHLNKNMDFMLLILQDKKLVSNFHNMFYLLDKKEHINFKFYLQIIILLIINILLWWHMQKKEIFNFNHQVMLHQMEKIAVDVVEMVFVTHLMENAHVILDGQTHKEFLQVILNVLNKLQENVLIIVEEMVNVKLTTLVYVMQDIC